MMEDLNKLLELMENRTKTIDEVNEQEGDAKLN